MPVKLVEIDQIDEDQALVNGIHRIERLGHSVGVVLRFLGFPNAAAHEHIEDLADAVDIDRTPGELIEQHSLRRRHGVVAAIGRAGECSGAANERPCNHPSHFVRAPQDLACDLANLVQLEKRDHLFVRRHLKNAVGGSVHDW